MALEPMSTPMRLLPSDILGALPRWWPASFALRGGGGQIPLAVGGVLPVSVEGRGKGSTGMGEGRGERWFWCGRVARSWRERALALLDGWRGAGASERWLGVRCSAAAQAVAPARERLARAARGFAPTRARSS